VKKLTASCLLLLIALSSCSATLRVKATAPTNDNDGTCAGPVLVAMPAGTPRVMHFAWAGPVSGEDSISTTAGTLVTFSRGVPPGIYTVRTWASDAGGVGCDTTATFVVKAPPARPTLVP